MQQKITKPFNLWISAQVNKQSGRSN